MSWLAYDGTIHKTVEAAEEAGYFVDDLAPCIIEDGVMVEPPEIDMVTGRALGLRTCLLADYKGPLARLVGARPRTGFPQECPIGRADPVKAINCDGCEYRQRDQRGYWRCDHSGYQAAPGVHFCLDCGIELGPYAEAHGWERCGGSQGRCKKDKEPVYE